MDIVQTILIALTIGLAAGAIGSFIVLRRMSLVGDAMSHVALPGIALALAYGLDPFWGVLVFLLAAAVIVWWLQNKTKLPADALVGLLFVGSLAIGILTIPNTEIYESLFGAFPRLSPAALFFVLAAAILAIAFIFASTRKFLFFIFAKELAAVHKIGQKEHLLLLSLFALIVALGIKLVGALLMGALVIIPPLVARNLARSMKSLILLSSFFGAFTSVLGAVTSFNYHLPPGPAIIIIGLILFIFSLPFVKSKNIV